MHRSDAASHTTARDPGSSTVPVVVESDSSQSESYTQILPGTQSAHPPGPPQSTSDSPLSWTTFVHDGDRGVLDADATPEGEDDSLGLGNIGVVAASDADLVDELASVADCVADNVDAACSGSISKGRLRDGSSGSSINFTNLRRR